MNKVRHCWPGTEPRLRLVHDSRRLKPRQTLPVTHLDTSPAARFERFVRGVGRALWCFVRGW